MTASTEKKEQKGLLKKYLDNTFGDEGLKTDVKITLTNETVIKIILTVVLSSVLGTAAHIAIKKMLT